jgi:hypothetical protein
LQLPFLQFRLLQQSLSLSQESPFLPHVQLPFLHVPSQQSLSLSQESPSLPHLQLPLLQVPEQQSLSLLQESPLLPHLQLPFLHVFEQQSLSFLQLEPLLLQLFLLAAGAAPCAAATPGANRAANPMPVAPAILSRPRRVGVASDRVKSSKVRSSTDESPGRTSVRRAPRRFNPDRRGRSRRCDAARQSGQRLGPARNEARPRAMLTLRQKDEGWI